MDANFRRRGVKKGSEGRWEAQIEKQELEAEETEQDEDKGMDRRQ